MVTANATSVTTGAGWQGVFTDQCKPSVHIRGALRHAALQRPADLHRRILVQQNFEACSAEQSVQRGSPSRAHRADA
eukprot:10446-Heterococcus_DN1.PRE.2